MPRFNVEVDGEWACFSTIVDAFITPLMPLEQYEEWRDFEYGKQKIALKESNRMTLKECLESLSLNKSDEEIVKNLRMCGLMYEKTE